MNGLEITKYDVDHGKISDGNGVVLDLNTDHPRYKYFLEIILQSVNGYGWYYGVPHAILYRTESPELIKKIGHTLQRWGCAWPRWLYWTGIGGKLRGWATAILEVRFHNIQIRRGQVFHDLEVEPYGPDSQAWIDADQYKTRHEIYQEMVGVMRCSLDKGQLNGQETRLRDGQGVIFLALVNETDRKLRQLHGHSST